MHGLYFDFLWHILDASALTLVFCMRGSLWYQFLLRFIRIKISGLLMPAVYRKMTVISMIRVRWIYCTELLFISIWYTARVTLLESLILM